MKGPENCEAKHVQRHQLADQLNKIQQNSQNMTMDGFLNQSGKNLKRDKYWYEEMDYLTKNEKKRL